MKTNTRHWASITAGILSLAGYASAASLGSEKYTYDASGNIVEKSIDSQVTKMTYDSSNRLTERQAIGQSNEITNYDAAGRPIAMKDGTGQLTRSMSYGYGDKVLESENHGANTGFYYNSEGQLVGKTTSSGVATYTWDGNVLAADGGETFTNEAHPTGGIPVMAGDRDIVVSDFLGNTLSKRDQQYSSTAYGEGLELARFTGKAFVKELDSYVFQHRLYSADTSCWTVADPSGFPDGNNNYQYVCANPVNAIDALGLDCNWICNGEVSNLTPSCGGAGFEIEIDSDGYRTKNFNAAGAVVKTRDGYSEAWADSNKALAIAYVAANGGSYTHIESGTGMKNFTLQPGDNAIDAHDVEDADDVISSVNPVSKKGCGKALLALPYKISWSNALIYEH